MDRMQFGDRFDSLLTAVRVYLLSESQRRQVPQEETLYGLSNELLEKILERLNRTYR